MSSHLPESGVTHKELQRQCLEGWDSLPDALQLRIHRALSWIGRAEREAGDADAAFIFYWIAFNAVYAEDSQEAEWASERRSFREYFSKIVGLDKDNVVYDAIWERFSHEIRVFLNNRYVFEPFWKFHNGVSGYDEWGESFDRSKRAAGFALARQDTSAILSILFDRLYVLRNQLIHGGATWRSSVNRDQVRDGRRIVAFLVPRFVQIMVTNPQEPWGAPYYPVVQGRGSGPSLTLRNTRRSDGRSRLPEGNQS